jgi:hypothetical protein
VQRSLDLGTNERGKEKKGVSMAIDVRRNRASL